MKQKQRTFKMSRHACQEIERRAIPLDYVESVLHNPQEIVPERDGKKVYQSEFDFAEGRTFLVRVLVDDTVEPAMVITAYRTSKINKYRRL
ncbi:MAG: DUF4258 domain-containing protein [Pseudomonadota bacterium]